MALSRSGLEILVNLTAEGTQAAPTVLALPNGGFTICYGTTERTGSSGLLRSFDAAGNGGAESSFGISIGARPEDWNAVVSLDRLVNGAFVAAYTALYDYWGRAVPPDDLGPGDISPIELGDLRLRMLENGVWTEIETGIPMGDQYEPEIESLTDGRFVISWYDYSLPGSGQPPGLRGQVYNADGSLSGAGFTLDSGGNSSPQCELTSLSNGRFLATWFSGSGSARSIKGQVLSGDGAAAGAEFAVPASAMPSIAALAGGGFVMTWQESGRVSPDGSGYAVLAQTMDDAGNRVGTRLIANQVTAGNQLDPVVTALSDGRFVIAWTDYSYRMGDANAAICAQVFNADGSYWGDEFRVNSTTEGIQQDVTITELADGRVVFAWTDFSALAGDTSGAAVRAQIFDLRMDGVDVYGSDTGDTLVGTIFEDLLDGRGGADSLVGADGDDILVGGAGNDTLDGGTGADWMRGGSGDDLFQVDNGTDRVFELTAGGNDTVVSSVGFTMSANLEVLQLTGAADVEGRGNAMANQLVGNAGANGLWGNDGNDTLEGGLGADTLNGGGGADWMYGGLGDDVFTVNEAGDRVVEAAGGGIDKVFSGISLVLGAEVENLTLTGLAALDGTGNALSNDLRGNGGNNRLFGQGGADTLLGGGGNDRLDGGAGADVMMGQAGDDSYIVNAPGDLVQEMAGEGADTVYAAINFRLGANLEALALTGTANVNGTGNDSANRINGNGGANLLDGGAGADTLEGAAGADVLRGGAGADVFAFRAGSGSDRIVDFADNVDQINLDGAIWGGGLSVQQVLGFYATATTQGVFFDFGGGNTLLVAGLAQVSVLADDIAIV